MNANIERRHCAICGVERDTPSPAIEGLAGAPDAFARALEGAASTAGAGWSPREVIAHMADSEIVFGWRIRRTLTFDDPVIEPYDESLWAAALFYGERDAATALDTFGATRRANVELLRRAGTPASARAYRQEGSRRTLDELVRHRADHDLQHLAQIARR